jgi:hypothetical protein
MPISAAASSVAVAHAASVRVGRTAAHTAKTTAAPSVTNQSCPSTVFVKSVQPRSSAGDDDERRDEVDPRAVAADKRGNLLEDEDRERECEQAVHRHLQRACRSGRRIAFLQRGTE